MGTLFGGSEDSGNGRTGTNWGAGGIVQPPQQQLTMGSGPAQMNTAADTSGMNSFFNEVMRAQALKNIEVGQEQQQNEGQQDFYDMLMRYMGVLK